MFADVDVNRTLLIELLKEDGVREAGGEEKRGEEREKLDIRGAAPPKQIEPWRGRRGRSMLAESGAFIVNRGTE